MYVYAPIVRDLCMYMIKLSNKTLMQKLAIFRLFVNE